MLYLALYSSPQSPLVAIPLVLGLAAPVAGVVAAPLTTLLLLYLDTPFIAYALAPPLLLALSRVFSSWRQVLVILLVAPTILLYPGLAPIVLGAAVASFSSEDEIGAPLSGLVATLNLYASAGLLLPGDVVAGGLLLLPGGIVSRLSSATQIGMAGEFYVLLLQKMQSTIALIAGLALLPAASLAATLVRERYGPGEAAVAATALVSLETLLLPEGLGGGLWGLIGFLASCGAIEVAAQRLRAGRGGRGGPPRAIPSPPIAPARDEEVAPVRPATPSVERDILEILMYDLRDLAETVKRIAGRGARIIVMGPRLEDEEMFIEYTFAGSPPPNVVPSHALGPRWYEEVKGYVAYVAPLDPEEVVDIVEAYCRLQGVQLDAAVLGMLRARVKGISRYMVARMLEEIKSSGCTPAAVLEGLGVVEQDISPQFFVEFERVQQVLPVLGLKR